MRVAKPASVLALTLAVSACAPVIDHVIAGAVSAPAADVVAAVGADPMHGDPQTLMTRLRAPRTGDSARAEPIAAQMRAGISRYRDTADAYAAGYRPFPAEPPPTLRIVHYTHPRQSRREADKVDYTWPGALLYERTRDGSLRLIGAMISAPVDASLEELDHRVPLSITQWHLHRNICVPKPVWSKDQWARLADGGRPLFGPGSPIVTEAACNEIGGRFLPTVFGWMAHVYVFADRREDVWNAMYGHGS